jgi:long-chain fatty acid transport protein
MSRFGARAAAAAFCAVGLLTVAAPAAANPAEVFGFGSRSSGRGGAAAASADDFSALYYNPAGLAFGGSEKQVTLGALGAVSNLTIQDRRIGISEPFGFVVGLRTPAPLGGPLADRLHLGIGLYGLPGTVVQIKARLPDEPFYPYYDNRTQRIVLLPGAAVKILPGLSVGVAINFLATLRGQVTATEGATRAVEARVDEEIPSVARLNAGVRWRPAPLPQLDLAVAFRQSFSIPFATVAETMVAGEPINLDIAAAGQYTPTQITAGAAWRAGRALAELDLTWANWSAYPGPYVQVKSELPLVGPLAGELPEVPFSDTWGARLGGQVDLGAHRQYALRAGYGFETSAFPEDQPGVTNLLDGYKNTVSLGFGVRLPAALGDHDVRIDMHAQSQLVGRRTLSKRIAADDENAAPFDALRDEVEDDPNDPATQGAQISNPGFPNLRSGGEVYSAGVTMEVVF